MGIAQLEAQAAQQGVLGLIPIHLARVVLEERLQRVLVDEGGVEDHVGAAHVALFHDAAQDVRFLGSEALLARHLGEVLPADVDLLALSAVRTDDFVDHERGP